MVCLFITMRTLLVLGWKICLVQVLSMDLGCVSAILLDLQRLMTIVKFPLNVILVEVCKENDLPRNPLKHEL